jgi:hypothetical protein
MSAFKFLVDENVGRSVGDYLIEKGYDVVVTKESFRAEKTCGCLIMPIRTIESW